MAYTKKVWVDDVTPISATNMNNIEDKIESLATVTEEIATQAEAEAGVVNNKYVTPLRVKNTIGVHAVPIASLPGDFLIYSDTVSGSSDSTSFVKLREIQLGVSGTLRIEFKCGSPGTGECRIYRNGVPVGTLRTFIDVATTFIEDVAGWSVGDKLQIYARKTSSTNVAVCNIIKLYTAAAQSAFSLI